MGFDGSSDPNDRVWQSIPCLVLMGLNKAVAIGHLGQALQIPYRIGFLGIGKRTLTGETAGVH